MKTKEGERYTDTQLVLITELYNAGCDDDYIADRLSKYRHGATDSTVRSKRVRMGLTSEREKKHAAHYTRQTFWPRQLS